MSDISQSEATHTITTLNDGFRTTFAGGSVFTTIGIQALGPDFVAEALGAVRSFSAFTQDNDPHHEHDFGSLTVQGEKLFWKIDAYDPSMKYGSEDPSNPKVTRRVLTVMLAGEY